MTKGRAGIGVGLALLLACGDAAGPGGATPGGGGAGAGGTAEGAGASGGSAAGGADAGGAGGALVGGGGGAGGMTCAGPTPAPGGGDPDPGTPGEAQRLVDEEDPLWGFALDATHVYWTAGANPGRVSRVPKDGGQVEILDASLVDPYTPFLDDGYLYFGDDDLTLKRIATSGGCVEVLADGQDVPTSVAFDATYAYFTTFNDGAVRRVPKAGGAVEELASGQASPSELVVDDSFVYWLNKAGNVVDEGTVLRVAKGGGTPELLASGLTVPRFLRFYQDGLIFGTTVLPSQELEVRKIPLDGGAGAVLFLGANTTGYALEGDVLFETTVYPHQAGKRDPIDSFTLIADCPSRCFEPLTDADHVYWIEYDTSDIGRTPKP